MKDRNITAIGIMIWLICAIFFTYEFLLRTVLGTFQHPIMYDLKLTPFSFALLSSTAFISIYGLMQVPVGLITDRFGLKKSLSVATIICGVSGIAFAMTYQLKWAILVRMMMGFGASFGFICLLVAVYDWMPQKRFGFFIGLSQFIGTMGPMMAAGPLHTLATTSGVDWRSIFIGLGIFGFALVGLIFFFVKNNHDNLGGFRIINRPTSIKSNIYAILRQKQTWIIAIYSASIFFTLEYLSENEGKAYLELNGYEPGFASYMITIGWIGYAVGCPLLGFISDLIKHRKGVMIFSAIACLWAMTVIMFYPLSKHLMMLAFFMLGMGAAGQSIGFATIAEQCQKFYLAAGLGFNNAMIAFVSAVNAPMIGWLLDFHSEGAKHNHQDYAFAFSIIFILLSLALVLSMFFIKETFCRPTKEFSIITR